jgi:hypothetical protein
MNKKERVRAALAMQPVDWVPASFWYHFRPEAHTGSASVEAHDLYCALERLFLAAALYALGCPANFDLLRPTALSTERSRPRRDEGIVG